MHIAAPQILGADHLARGGLDQRRTGQKDCALFFHDDRHIRHRGHIGPARGARSHDHRDLGDALAAHPRLIIENPAKVVTVGKDLVLIGQVRAAAIDQIDAGQMVFLGDLLGTQVFFDTHREIGAALHRRIIAHDHAVDALHLADTRDHTRRGGRPAIKPMRRQRTDLKEGRTGVEQIGHPFAGQHLAAAHVARARFLAAAQFRRIRRLADGLQGSQMRGLVRLEAFGRGQGLRNQLHVGLLDRMEWGDVTGGYCITQPLRQRRGLSARGGSPCL